MSIFIYIAGGALLFMAGYVARSTYCSWKRGKERSRRIKRMEEESEAEIQMAEARWRRAFGNWQLEREGTPQ